MTIKTIATPRPASISQNRVDGDCCLIKLPPLCVIRIGHGSAKRDDKHTPWVVVMHTDGATIAPDDLGYYEESQARACLGSVGELLIKDFVLNAGRYANAVIGYYDVTPCASGPYGDVDPVSAAMHLGIAY
jgi:hypothetical protein